MILQKEKYLRYNRSLSKHSRVFFLDSAHLLPLVVSVTFGVLVGQFRNLNFFWTILMMAWPFVTWLVAVGDKPWKYLAKFDSVPRWTRGRLMMTNPIYKRKVGRIVK